MPSNLADPPDCKAWFSELVGDRDDVKRICELSEMRVVECETHTVSDHSPGIVCDSEQVAHQILSPHQYDPIAQQFNLSAFEEVFLGGLSTLRLAHAPIERCHAQGAERARLRQKNYQGAVTFEVQELRGLTLENGKRALWIFDTALPEESAHADVMALLREKAEKKAAARLLVPIAERNQLTRPAVAGPTVDGGEAKGTIAELPQIEALEPTMTRQPKRNHVLIFSLLALAAAAAWLLFR